jgi:hypothetical protein
MQFLLNFGIHSDRKNILSKSASKIIEQALSTVYKKGVDNWSPSDDVIIETMADERITNKDLMITLLHQGKTLYRVNNSDEVFFTIESFDI